MSVELTISYLWLLWFLSWCIAARWAAKTTARPRASSQRLYQFARLAGVFLLFYVSTSQYRLAWQLNGRRLGPLTRPLWNVPSFGNWLLIGLTLLGFAFCWWARIHLGKLWSSTVTQKADHHIVDTGPYRLVRHPIYAGILISASALVLLKATPISLIGYGLMIWGYWLKAEMEERFLREQLRSGAYEEYRSHTPMLIPFWPTR